MMKKLLQKLWKKSSKPYPKSLSKRLTRRIMIVLFVVMAIPALLVSRLGYNSVILGVGKVFQDRMDGDNQRIRRLTSDIYVASVNTVPQIEENLDHPEKMYQLLERMVQLNPRINSCGISFKENYYPAKGRAFCPYAVRRDSIVEIKTLGGDGHGYLGDAWFTEAMAADSAYWSKPFFSKDGKHTPSIAYLMPIHDSSRQVVAILGVDLSLDFLTKTLQKKTLFEPSVNTHKGKWSPDFEIYNMVVDKYGNYLVHPDCQRLVEGNILTEAHKSSDSTYIRMAGNMVSGASSSWHSFMDEATTMDGQEDVVFYRPVKKTDWTVAVVIPKLFMTILGYLIGGSIFLLIFFALIVVFFAGRYIILQAVKPIRLLAVTADEVAKGNFNVPLPVIKKRDEVCQLRDSFEKMQHSLAHYVEDLKQTTAQKASIESELKIAHSIQMSMLPKTFPPYPERSDIDIYGLVDSAKAVGGDLFDFFIRDEKLFFCIGDVSGKGVPASLFMAVTRSLFRNITAHVAEPQEIVNTLNNAICDGNDQDMFVTFFVGVLDLPTGRLDYCNAGHESPLLVGQDVGLLPCEPNLPIGIQSDWNFKPQKTDIAPGTTIFLYTDGLNEAENAAHMQFGDERILEVARGQLSCQQHQPASLITAMRQTVHSFVGNAEQSDDLTMLAIQYTKQ